MTAVEEPIGVVGKKVKRKGKNQKPENPLVQISESPETPIKRQKHEFLISPRR